MASAAFSIDGNQNHSTTTAGAVVNLALLSVSGAGVIEWSILGGSDSTQTPPTIVAAGSPPGATASFTMNPSIDGAIGLTWVVQCKINSGVDSNGQPIAGYTAKGIVGVPNELGILPFAFGEDFQRGVNGIADDLNKALKLAAAGQTSATYSNTVQTSSATTTPLQTIPLSDNTKYRIYLFLSASDTGSGEGEWISFTSWYRKGGGSATQGGTDFGPAPWSTIGTGLITGAWVTVAGSGNNVVVSVVTVGAAHCKFTYRIYVVSDVLGAAT